MPELKAIKATPKTGGESLTENGEPMNYSLQHFWEWSGSDILSNATRGKFAEFIVGTAIGLKRGEIRDEWGAYDLTTEEGIKIEVKSAAYIQSWYQKSYSTISFSIKPARYWDAQTNQLQKKPKRHADLYVFCHLKHKDQDTIDLLKMEQWDFYILPTFKLDNYPRSQSSITLKSLKTLADPKTYSELKSEISKAFQQQKNYRNPNS